MLRFARHAMLVLSIVALLAVLYIAYGMRQLEVYETVKLPTPLISGEIQKFDDLAKLKLACSELAHVMDRSSVQRSKDFDDLVALTRLGLKIALGFATISVVVLLLGWVAAGRVTRTPKQGTPPG